MAVVSAWRFCSGCGFNVEKEELGVSVDEITQVGGEATEIRLAEGPILLGQQGRSETAAASKADEADKAKQVSISADVAGSAAAEEAPVASGDDNTLTQKALAPAPQVPLAQVENATVAEKKDSLVVAVELGRYAEANRELLKMEGSGGDACSILDAAAIERVKRIGAKFISAQRLLKIKPQDLKANEVNPTLKLKWGMKLENNLMQLVSVTEFDADFYEVLALDLEADLEDKISEDEVSQVMLSQPHAHDVSWRKRMVKAGVGTKADDIMMVSVVDALDEPEVKAVCTVKYTLAEGDAADPFGNAIPPLAKGHLRTPYVMTATAFAPLACDGDKICGVRKIECMEVELAPTVAKVLGMMPNFMLKKLCRGSVETKAKLIPEVLRESQELKKRMQMAPRSDFLDQVRRHIAEGRAQR